MPSDQGFSILWQLVQTIKFGMFSAMDTGVVLEMLCLHLIKRQFVVLCNSALHKSGTNDCWSMSSSYISVRTNTQNSFLRCTWRRWNSSKQGINVKKGFQAQTLALTDPWPNFQIWFDWYCWNLESSKQEREDLKTNQPPTDTSAGMLLDFGFFPGTMVEFSKHRMLQGDSKGIHSYHPPSYLLGDFLHFWSFGSEF